MQGKQGGKIQEVLIQVQRLREREVDEVGGSRGMEGGRIVAGDTRRKSNECTKCGREHTESQSESGSSDGGSASLSLIFTQAMTLIRGFLTSAELSKESRSWSKGISTVLRCMTHTVLFSLSFCLPNLAAIFSAGIMPFQTDKLAAAFSSSPLSSSPPILHPLLHTL